MKTQNVNVEALVKKAGENKVTNAAIKSAIQTLQNQKQKDLEEQIVGHIATIQSVTESAVKALRVVRAKEKATKRYLQLVANAEQAFYENADYSAYNNALIQATKETGIRIY